MESRTIIAGMAVVMAAMIGMIVGGGLIYLVGIGQSTHVVEVVERPIYVDRNFTTVIVRNITYEQESPVRLEEPSTTSSTTSSTVTSSTMARRSNAVMFGLFNPADLDTDGLGQFVVNRSVGMRIKTVDGSNRWSDEGVGYQLFWIERQDARLYLEQMSYDSNVEGVYAVGRNSTMLMRLKAGDLDWTGFYRQG